MVSDKSAQNEFISAEFRYRNFSSWGAPRFLKCDNFVLFDIAFPETM